MRLVHCHQEEHGAAILEILNHEIEHSTSLYYHSLLDTNWIAAWFAGKAAGDFPVIGAEDEHGALLGFASYGVYDQRAGYKYTVEHSVYVAHERRGRGIGQTLLQSLIAQAATQQLHVMIGRIDAGNRRSIALHERLGFEHAGTLRQVGFKFGRWLDVALYQLILQTPDQPNDG